MNETCFEVNIEDILKLTKKSFNINPTTKNNEIWKALFWRINIGEFRQAVPTTKQLQQQPDT